MSEESYLLLKRGLYYAPNNQGYTGVKDRAGRYPETDASPEHGVTAVHEDLAPTFAPACYDDIKVKYLQGIIERQADLSARIIARADTVLALPVSDTFADGFREAWREARLMARGE